MFDGWGVGEWSALVSLFAYLGFDGPRGFSFGRSVLRRMRGEEEEPQKVIVVTPDVGEPDPEPIPIQLPWINFPPGAPLIGRETEIEDMRVRLGKRGDLALVNSRAILAGQGGIGKTTLARGYAEERRRDYDGGLWVNAAEDQSLWRGIARLAEPLGMTVEEPFTRGDAERVIQALQTSPHRWLVIYDNVEDREQIRSVIPDPQCRNIHLIVTTRAMDGWAGFDVKATDTLSTEEPDGPAVRLLLREGGKPDDGKAHDLAIALGGLPLALVVAGGLVRAFDSYGDWLGRLNEVIAAAPKSGDYPDAVIGAVRLSYDRLSADARALIDVMAWWAPEGLEPRLFTDAPGGDWWDLFKEDVQEDLARLCGDPGRVRAAFLELEGRSLLLRQGETWALHRMTAAALLAGETAEVSARVGAALLMAVYPGGEKNPSYSENWPDCARLTPHVQALFDTGRLPETAAMDSLLNQAGIYLRTIADVETGLAFARASLALTEARLPEDDPKLAFGYHNHGVALMRAGDLEGAEVALRRAVELHEAHRPGSADLADSYNALAFVFMEQRRGGAVEAVAEAGAFFDKALALRQDLFGRKSEPVAEVLTNFSVLRDLEGRQAEAAELAEEALRIDRKVLPEGDARLGYSLNSAGALALKAGAAGRAEALLDEALALWEAVHADRPAHPEPRNTAGWQISALLVNARRGAGGAERFARAQALATQYGFDWAAQEAFAAQFPDPVDQPPT